MFIAAKLREKAQDREIALRLHYVNLEPTRFLCLCVFLYSFTIDWLIASLIFPPNCLPAWSICIFFPNWETLSTIWQFYVFERLKDTISCQKKQGAGERRERRIKRQFVDGVPPSHQSLFNVTSGTEQLCQTVSRTWTQCRFQCHEIAGWNCHRGTIRLRPSIVDPAILGEASRHAPVHTHTHAHSRMSSSHLILVAEMCAIRWWAS